VNLPGAVCLRIARRAPADEIDQRWVDDVWEFTIPQLDGAVKALTDEIAALDAVEDETGYLAAMRTQFSLAIQWGRMCRSCLWAAIVYHRMGSWDTSHGPWRDDQAEMLKALNDAMDALDKAEELIEPGTLLVIGRTESPNRMRRFRTLRPQLAAAIEAAEQGARPAPLPQQDPYPYAR